MTLRTTLCFTLLYVFTINAQEQVSNVVNNHILEPIDLDQQLGFAQINGVNYMIMDNDSINIYNIEAGECTLIHTIDNIDTKRKYGVLTQANRSRFEIIGSKYYRIGNSNISVIDVPSGKVEKTFSFQNSSVSFVHSNLILDQKIYFSAWQNFQRKIFIYDFNQENLDSLPIAISDLSPLQIEHNFIYLKDGNVIAYNSIDRSESTLLSSLGTLKLFQKSPEDNTVKVVDNNNMLYTIDKSLNLDTHNCLFDIPDNFISLDYKNDRLFVTRIDSTISFQLRKRIDVINTLSCTKESEIDFEYDVFDSNQEPIFYRNEKDEKNFTIFAMEGDYYSSGKISIIDHLDQSITRADLSFQTDILLDFSPIRFENKIYISSISYGDLGYGSGGIFYLDTQTKEVDYISPFQQNISTYRGIIGFPDEKEELITAYNLLEEDPLIVSINQTGNFSEIKRLNVSENIGFYFNSNIKVNNNRIYCKTYGKVYSIADETIELTETKEAISFIYGPENVEFASHQNDIGFIPYKDSIQVHVINSNDELEVYNYGKSMRNHEDYFAIGSYLFFNRRDSLVYFDLEKKSYNYFEGEFSHINKYRSCRTENRIASLKTVNNVGSIFVLDFETLSPEKLDINLEGYPTIISGRDDRIYVIDRATQSDISTIYTFDRDNNKTIIYEGLGKIKWPVNKLGPGNEYNYDYKLLLLEQKSNEFLVISNGEQTTYSFKIKHKRHPSTIVKFQNNSGVILESSSDGINEYLFFDYWSEPKSIRIVNDSISLKASFMKDNFAYLIFQEDKESLALYKYDRTKGTLEELDIVGLENAFKARNVFVPLEEDRFLLSLENELGSEPWLLDLFLNKTIMLKDIYPGEGSSLISNITSLNEYKYFTAIAHNGVRQWFRIGNNVLSSLEKPQFSEEYKINIFPSPATSEIFLERNYSKVLIYRINGQLVKSIDNYQGRDSIGIEGLPNGIYIVKTLSDNTGQFKSAKFSVTH